MQCKIILFTAFFFFFVIALLPLFQRLGNSFSSFDGIGAPSPGALPCLKAGRVMPVSSAAADSLKLASGRTSVNLGGSRTGPVKWLLALNACPAKMAGEPFLRSDNRDMVEFLGGRGRYFSYADAVEKAGLLRGSLRGNSHQAHAAEAILGALAVYEQAGVALALRLEGTSGCLGTLDAWHEAMVEASAELEAAEREKRHPSLDRLYRANRYFQFLQALVQVEEADPNVALRVIPHEGSYLTPAAALLEKNLSPAGRTALKAYAAACDAYAAGDESTAAETLRQLSGELESILPMDSFKLHFEHCINALEPFFGGFLLYGMSLVCFVVSLFLKRRKALLHFATVFLCMAVLWHLFGIAARMYIQSRPPVTNLYSSVVFAGVVASLFGGTLYILRRQLPVAAVACASGLLSLLVAMNLPYSGDTMGMMRAVLNSNFWLTMHVMTIMIGYGSVFFAGFLASYHLVARFFGFGQGEKGLKAGSCGVYRILLVALFFCFLGTMLGGIWADMSWGRFWGWDPKENGALMTLLWCSCTLHARLLHVCSCQGFLVLASLGNIVAAWGWFGVNLMGIGLHSYGFVEGGWFWFFLFVGLQVLAAASALIPQRSR